MLETMADITDYQGKSAAAVMKEIKLFLSNSYNERTRKSSLDNDDKSPYKSMKLIQLEKKKKVIARRAKKKPMTFEDVVNKTYENLDNKEYDRYNAELMEIKSFNLPYFDSMMKVQEYVRLSDKFDERKRKKKKLQLAEKRSVSGLESIASSVEADYSLTVTRLIKKYPRLCKGFKLDVETNMDLVSTRSDLWMYRFMEECYDESFVYCGTAISKDRWRLRNGLDLGSLEAFPLVVHQIINKTYSTLEVRQRICLEFLKTLEHLSQLSLSSTYSDREILRSKFPNCDTAFDGGRGLLFSKFLSEEYDVDALALYLSARETIQSLVQARLKELNTSRIWQDPTKSDGNYSKTVDSKLRSMIDKSPVKLSNSIDMDLVKMKRSASSTNPTKLSFNQIIGKSDQVSYGFRSPVADKGVTNSIAPPLSEKVVPLILPTHWNYVDDVVMPETPLVGFDSKIIGFICSKIVPSVSLTAKVLMTERLGKRILSSCRKLSESSQCRSDEVPNALVFPVAVYLKSLVEEWHQVPLETKLGFIQQGGSKESLKEFSKIYENNGEKMKSVVKKIASKKAELASCDAHLLSLSKQLRRLNRRRANGLASDEEIDAISNLKASENEAELKKMELEAFLKELLRNEKQLQKSIEELWNDALRDPFAPKGSAGSSKKKKLLDSLSSPSPMRFHSPTQNWRRDVSQVLLEVILFNKDSEREHAIAAAHARKIDSERLEQQKKLERESEEKQQQEYLMNRTTIIQVMSRTFVRMVTQAGTRSIALKKYLIMQERKLKLQLGDPEAWRIERERIRKEKEEEIRLLKRKYALIFIDQMKTEIVDESVIEGKRLAGIALFDPYGELDWDLSRWLPASIIGVVNCKFQSACHRHYLRVSRIIFNTIAKPFRILKLSLRIDRRILRACFKGFAVNLFLMKALHANAKRVQSLVKHFLWRARDRRYRSSLTANNFSADKLWARTKRKEFISVLTFWQQWANLKARYKAVRFCLRERSIIINLYKWIELYKKHKFDRIKLTAKQLESCLLLQCAFRCVIAYRKVRKLTSQAVIVRGMKAILAKRRLYELMQQRKRLLDFERCCLIRHEHFESLHYFKIWLQSFGILKGCHLIAFADARVKYRKRFAKWKFKYLKRMSLLNWKACIIQSAARMYLVKVKMLNYYKWRRGLHKCQGLVRRRTSMIRFRHEIVYFRAAYYIQKRVRGMIVRNHITERRIADIHYAAETNNYDRLKYYIDRYPELVNKLDAEGNTALHSAAKGAAKRTLKLLVLANLDLNALNYAGYTPLHLLIQSNAVERDDLFFYMIDRGFDEDQVTADGKTCLFLAAEHGRNRILNQLLEDDLDPTIADDNGMTCLQIACSQGNLAMVAALVEHGADVNAPGYGGTFPLHDCVTSANIEIANYLFNHGAYVNVSDPYYFQTPLMWAAQAGKADFVRLFALQGARVNGQDGRGQSAAHYGAASDSDEIYHALREADADFDLLDLDGNCPLHLAAEYGSSKYAIHLLEGGANPSQQNNDGNQPAHIAARYENIDMLACICKYDDHLGRVNYEHQTPLGVAKFYGSKPAQQYLEHHFRMVEEIADRNNDGEIWWDKRIDEKIGDWEVEVDWLGKRTYVNRSTGEISDIPPKFSVTDLAKIAESVQLPVQRAIVLVKEADSLNKHTYAREYAEKELDVRELSKEHNAAVVIQKYTRRKLAYLEKLQLFEEKKRSKLLGRFVKRHMPKFRIWQDTLRSRSICIIQAVWRGYSMRKKFYGDGDYEILKDYHARLVIRLKGWYLWKRYLRLCDTQRIMLAMHLPKTLYDWQPIVNKAGKPKRVVGIIEEYLYTETRNIYFYRHASTGECYFDKPRELVELDEAHALETRQLQKHGASVKQINLAIKLQAIYRGYKVRCYSYYVESALELSLKVEKKYLHNPEEDTNLFNYALHCHVVLQDMDRARRLYIESLRRMEWRGPDLSFVLYSYSIFALLSHDQDYSDITMLLERARNAELATAHLMRTRQLQKEAKTGILSDAAKKEISAATFQYGRSYEFANIGFYRHVAHTKNNRYGWENLAICRFLVFNDFNSSFDAFMNSFRTEPKNQKLKENFDLMMTHFHGQDEEYKNSVVKERMRYHASIDAEAEEIRRRKREAARKRSEAARFIQKWYAGRKSQRTFNNFMKSEEQTLADRRRAANNASAGKVRRKNIAY